MKETVFKKRKGAIGFIVCLQSLFFGYLVYMLSIMPTSIWADITPLYFILLSFFFFVMIRSFVKNLLTLFNDTPPLILNEEGIIIDGQTDNFIIPWADVKEIRCKRVPKLGEQVFVIVYNPEEHIAMISSTYERTIAKARNLQYGTPFFLVGSALGITNESLIAQLNEYLEEVRTNNYK